MYQTQKFVYIEQGEGEIQHWMYQTQTFGYTEQGEGEISETLEQQSAIATIYSGIIDSVH